MTQCPHVQENEAGTITNLQLRSWRPGGRRYTAEIPASADSKNKQFVYIHIKLYGREKKLEKAATFILKTGLSV